MRNIINFVFTFLVLLAGSHYFPDYVNIKDTETLILASFLMFAIAFVFGITLVFSILLIPIGIGCLTTIILFIVALLLTPIRLYILDMYLPGFEINGFWTYVVLSVSLMFFTIKAKTETKSNNQSL